MNNTLLMVCTNVLVPLLTVVIGSSWFANIVSKRLNSNDIVKRLDDLEAKFDYNKADTYRTRILRFSGEIRRGVHHDEEEFNDCLLTIDRYEEYCKKHPDYPNNKAVLAIENIKRVYRELLASNSFN